MPSLRLLQNQNRSASKIVFPTLMNLHGDTNFKEQNVLLQCMAILFILPNNQDWFHLKDNLFLIQDNLFICCVAKPRCGKIPSSFVAFI